MRLSRRSLLKTAARLGAGAGLALLGLGGGERSEAQEESEAPFFRESATKLTLGNQYYEVDFDKRNGAITWIFDKRGGGVVSEGNADGSLWSLLRNTHSGQGSHSNEIYLWSNQVARAGFDYQWRATDRKLTFRYDVSHAGTHARVTINIQTSNESSFDLGATVEHVAGARIDWCGFPHRLGFLVQDINEALYPKLPGTLFQREWFEREPYEVQAYPGGTFCGDLTWIDLKYGTLAVYQVAPESRSPTLIGYAPQWGKTPARTSWTHDFALGIESDSSLELPVMRVAVGETLPAAITNYRDANGIDRYSPVDAKLDDAASTVKRSPLMKMDPYDQSRSLSEINAMADHAEAPAMLHPMAYTEQRFDTQNPDWWPPAERRGGPADYRTHFRDRQRDGFLVMPYTNPTWWCPTSHTNDWLEERTIELDDIAARHPDDNPQREEYCSENRETNEWYDCKPGVVASPSDPIVRERLDILMQQQIDEHSDLVFEDQIGARPWVWDYHDASPSPRSYSDAWLRHNHRHVRRRLMTESGDDQLAQVQAGFCATMLSWERHWKRAWGGTYWRYYPVSAMMVRDKTLLYQHDLEGHNSPSVTESLRMLRWNLAYGHQLNFDLWAQRHPWLPIVTAFSHHVLGSYAGELMKEWRGDPTAITTSVFDTVTVTGNWTDDPHVVGAHTLVPGGVVSASHDDTVTGGVFQSYNGRELSPGEHYLIEQRKPNGVIVRQPMGDSTALRLSALPDWATSRSLRLRAFSRSDHLLSAHSAPARGASVDIRYESVAASAQEWSSFRASISLGERNVGDGLREADLGWTTSVAEVRDGRPCRREVQMTASEAQHGYIAFEVRRDLFVGESEADCVVDVEWWDGGGLQGSEHDYLGLVFDGAVFEEGHTHSAVTGGWAQAVNDQQWKTARFTLPRAVFRKRVWNAGADIAFVVPGGVCIGKVTVTNADELERRTVAYYTIHDPTQGETLTQGLHLRGWTDATQPIAELDLNGVQAIYAWDADAASWLLYSPDVPAQFNNIDTLEQGRAYYVRVRNRQTLHWPDAPYGGVGFHLQPGRNLVCWLGTPNKTLTDAIAPLRGMKAEPLVSVQLDGKTYDVEESRSATEPLPYGQAIWVEIDAVGPTRWLQF